MHLNIDCRYEKRMLQSEVQLPAVDEYKPYFSCRELHGLAGSMDGSRDFVFQVTFAFLQLNCEKALLIVLSSSHPLCNLLSSKLKYYNDNR